MRALMILILSLCASAAMATVDAWPALYDVSGVAADDTLNIRSEPNASAEIVGELAADAVDIEVIGINDAETWGLVNSGEGSGWVSLAYMTRQPDQYSGRYPPITSCYGTEPFWGLSLSETGATLSFFGDPVVSGLPVHRTQSANRIDRFGLVAGEMSAIIVEQSCNDGMSDREFGLAVEVLAPLDGAMQQLSGCCTIQP